jgi:hypothetical protein
MASPIPAQRITAAVDAVSPGIVSAMYMRLIQMKMRPIAEWNLNPFTVADPEMTLAPHRSTLRYSCVQWTWIFIQ